MSLRKKSFLDESVPSINKNIQLANLTGITRTVKSVRDADLALHDYDSGSVIILGITGNTDINVTLPEPNPDQVGLYYTFISKATPSGTGDCVISTVTGTDNIVSRSGAPLSIVSAPAYTLTFAGALVTSNTIDTTINGEPMAQSTFATNSDTTMADIATKIQALSCVTTAAVTEVADAVDNDRVITVTGAVKGVPLNIDKPTIAAGSSQTTCTVAVVTHPVATVAGQTNHAADTVTLEAASIGGEWIQFISDGTFWYCSSNTLSNGTSLSLGG